MSAVILDTETTGTGDEDKVIEFARTELMAAPRELADFSEVNHFVFRFSSDRPISLGAMATHHIIEEDLQGFPPFIGWDPAAEGVEYIVGHNIDFDWRMLGKQCATHLHARSRAIALAGCGLAFPGRDGLSPDAR